ncbi:MAG: hypothetical protein HOM11_02705 [Methylococcales bacterium]|jgi:hypothetical protein|nr:hypothetical protein [Methylococcales bacterium]MBT7445234.1 hypothetical protein [Methylococcales bacterium]
MIKKTVILGVVGCAVYIAVLSLETETPVSVVTQEAFQPEFSSSPIEKAATTAVASSVYSENGHKLTTAADLYRPDWSELQKQQKFKRARIIWQADPTLSEHAKSRYVVGLAEQLWGKGADIPEMSSADHLEVQKQQEIFLTLQSYTQSIKEDDSMSSSEKKIALRKLLVTFVNRQKNNTTY